MEEIEFWSGNPQNTLQHGALQMKQISADLSQESLKHSINNQFLCCPQIPTYLHVVEFCMMIEDRNQNSSIFKKRDLTSLRVLKGPEPNQYIIILKFNSVAAVRVFVKEFHKRKFNQIEPDLCEVYTLETARIITE